MSDTQASKPHVSKDPRVIRYDGGTSHDWIATRSKEDALALIAEYGLRVKFDPQPQVDGIWDTAIF